MADEIEDKIIPDDTAEPGAPEVSEVEAAARAQGWVPKEEWTGEGKWRDAESFLDRGELFQKIDQYRRETRELKKNQEAFATHLQKVRELEYKRALDTLRREKKDALVEGDPEAVILVDEKIAAIREEAARASFAAEAQPQRNEPHPEFVEWTNQNKWYVTDEPMAAYADRLGAKLAERGLPPNEVLKEVAAQVRREFPNRFTNPNRAKASAVEGATASPKSSKETFQLSPVQRQVMERLVKSGALTKEQYIADLKADAERNQ
jgi:DNA-binding transcriptional ArsR family regulator